MNKAVTGVIVLGLFILFSTTFVSAKWSEWMCERLNVFCPVQFGPGPTGNNNDSGNVTHLECRNMQCVTIPGAGQNRCKSNAYCYNTVCLNNTCAQVPGNGSRACWPVGSSCGLNLTHLECKNNMCTRLQGGGANQCSPEGSYCNTNQTTNQTTHLECRNNLCALVNGSGTNQCLAPGVSCNVAGTLPDLIIESHTVSVENTTGNQSMLNVTIVTRVKNIGSALANVSTTFIRVVGGATDLNASVATRALDPGATQDIVRIYSLARGNGWVYSKADFRLVVAESNENNNQRTTQFRV